MGKRGRVMALIGKAQESIRLDGILGQGGGHAWIPLLRHSALYSTRFFMREASCCLKPYPSYILCDDKISISRYS